MVVEGEGAAKGVAISWVPPGRQLADGGAAPRIGHLLAGLEEVKEALGGEAPATEARDERKPLAQVANQPVAQCAIDADDRPAKAIVVATAPFAGSAPAGLSGEGHREADVAPPVIQASSRARPLVLGELRPMRRRRNAPGAYRARSCACHLQARSRLAAARRRRGLASTLISQVTLRRGGAGALAGCTGRAARPCASCRA